jgi:hypothetical protein
MNDGSSFSEVLSNTIFFFSNFSTNIWFYYCQSISYSNCYYKWLLFFI